MMSNNRLDVLPKANRFFKKLGKQDKQLQLKFKTAIQSIVKNPAVGDVKSGDLAGVYGYDIYHQGTNYEIAYYVEEDQDGNIVVVILAGTRENFYGELKRYMKTSNIKADKYN